MKTRRNFIIVFTVLLAIAVISTSVWAKRPVPPPPEPVCGLTGTWIGDAEGDLGWLAIHTSTDGIKGQMLMNWRYNTLINDPETTYEMMPGVGVWELLDSEIGTYSFTWLSQMTTTNSDPVVVYQVRVGGTAQMGGCDVVVIQYIFEIQIKDENGEYQWVKFDTGTAYEYRVTNSAYPPPVE